MAKELQSRKRKASVINGEAEKLKKSKKIASEDTDVAAKKRKAVEDPTPVTVNKPKTPKQTSEEAKPKTNKTKANGTTEEKDASSLKKSSKSNKSATDSKKKSKSEKAAIENVEASDYEVAEDEPVLDDEEEEEEDSEGSEDDDQTEAFLKGFESEGDDEDATNEEGLKPGQEIPKIPALSKKQTKQLTAAGDSEKPGVVYIGRIPHGFYENEMRAYFSQFGSILKLRLSRNRRTGQSKHIAWIQFESAAVADIVAKTMDSYLLFGHILKVKVVPDEQIPPNLFKGANRRFKKVPWNKIEGRKLHLAASESTWDKRIEREEKRREEKAKKLKEIGYEFEAPKIKSTKDVTKKPAEVQALPPAEEPKDSELTIEAPKPAKTKSKTKAKASEVEEPAEEVPALPAPEASKRQQKKNKKAKDTITEEEAAPTEILNGEKKTKKAKKPKSSA